MISLNKAKEAIDAIVQAVHPVSIVLFGSVAREGKGNDLDLMIVVDEKHGSVSKIQTVLHRCLADSYKRFAVDPFVVTENALHEAFSRRSPFLRMVAREGKVLYMKNAEHEWLRQAQEEMATAEYLFQGQFFKGCCYHAQQAAEKSLKGRLLGKGWELEKVHSIARLTAICRDFKIRLSLKDEDIMFLDSIYRGRYPAEEGLLPFHEPSDEDAQRALRIVQKLMRRKKSNT